MTSSSEYVEIAIALFRCDSSFAAQGEKLLTRQMGDDAVSKKELEDDLPFPETALLTGILRVEHSKSRLVGPIFLA